MHQNPFVLLLGLIFVAHLALVSQPASACGPGRAGGRRRMLRKYPPLVQRQYIPNVSENTLGASGRPEGAIRRKDKRFKELVQNWNPDIEFRDDERTGADRMMTQRLKEKLSVLAISVMNQWPNVKLRVIEGWDEDNRHSMNSLHYEGRAVDITTSDRDKSKYGMLARLAVEAGFDWVHYESRSHVHCSVKSEKADTIRNNGCFDAKSLVETPWGSMEMSQLQVNDLILTMNPQTGRFQFSPVIMWLDRDEVGSELYVELITKSGRQIRLTSSHLIYVADEVPAVPFGMQEAPVDLTNTTKYSLGEVNQTSQRETGNIADNSIGNIYLYETAATKSSTGTAQVPDVERESAPASAVRLPLGIDEYAFTTYSRNAIVGQFLLVHSPSEKVELGENTQLYGNANEKIPPKLDYQEKRSAGRLRFSDNSYLVQTHQSTPTQPTPTKIQFDQITRVDFVTKDGIYAPLTREGNVVVNSVVASCYAVISDHQMAHLSFAPIRWFSYMNEWLFGLKTDTPTQQRTIDSVKTNGDLSARSQTKLNANSDDLGRGDYQFVHVRRNALNLLNHHRSTINGFDRTTLDHKQQSQHTRNW